MTELKPHQLFTTIYFTLCHISSFENGDILVRSEIDKSFGENARRIFSIDFPLKFLGINVTNRTPELKHNIITKLFQNNNNNKW